MKYRSNNCGFFEIIEYKNAHNVRVRFTDTGYETVTKMVNIANGKVKDKFYPSVSGVGFIGCGEFKSKTKAYNVWAGMIQRCYNEKFRDRQVSYAGVEVCKDWHNFQNFAKWYNENKPIGNGEYEIDKDMKSGKNKMYSPETCVFMTKSENSRLGAAKSYEFLSPDGLLIKVYNLLEFSRERDLNSGHMSAVFNGKRESHKGWRKA